MITGTGMLVRSMRGPVWAQVLAMMGALLLFLTFSFPSGGEILRLIPTGETFRHFNTLLVDAGAQIRDQAVPVVDHDGLLLLTTAGVGLVAVLVDLAAVGLRRPALAGLPMLAIYSVPVAVLPQGLSVFPFAFAAIGFLWLLVADSVDRVRRFGRRFTGEGRDVDLWEPSPLSSAGRRLGAVGLAVAIVLPLALPGMTSGLIDRFGTGIGPGNGEGAGPAGAATVNLTAMLQDNLIRSEKFEMVRVRTSDPTPYYLRFGVAEEATPQGFVSQAPSSGSSVSRGIEAAEPQTPGVTTRRFRAEVEVVNLDMRLVPVYQQVVATENLGSAWFHDPASNQIFSRRESVNRQSYAFEFVRATYSATALRSASSIPPTDAYMRSMTALPVSTMVSNVVANLTEGKTLQYDRVKAIYDYFGTDEFVYSLSTAPGGDRQPDRGLPVQQARVLRAVRGRHGLDGAGGRISGPGGVRVHPRWRLERRGLLADQLQPARLDRGLLRGHRLGAVRRHTVGLGRRRRAVHLGVRPDQPDLARAVGEPPAGPFPLARHRAAGGRGPQPRG